MTKSWEGHVPPMLGSYAYAMSDFIIYNMAKPELDYFFYTCMYSPKGLSREL